MVRNINNGRSEWLLPLIAFLVGVLVGWWVIGWGVWPVKYTNSLPPDLRAAERDHYLIMTAESYAATGDVMLARERLATWPADQLATDLQTLRDRLMTENALQASQVQLLTGVLGLSAVSAAPTMAPTQAPTPAPVRSESLLRTLCTAGLWVVLALLGIVVGVWLYNRWRNAQARKSGPAIDETYRAPRSRSVAGLERISVTGADQVSPGEAGTEPAQPDLSQPWPRTRPEADTYGGEPWTEAELPSFLDGRRPSDARRPAAARESAPTAQPAAPSVVPGEPPASARPPATRREIARPPAPTAPLSVSPAAAPGKVGEYTAQFQMGESDYDEAFDVTDGGGVYLGQCGLELNDPIGRGHDQAAALQVWLWDTRDPDTQVKVLMSEGAYRDTALRDQLAGEHPAVPIRIGAEFELESYNLLLRGRVEKLEYAEQEPVGGVFAELAVRMVVYQKGR
ncbi:MAG: hypothetical protein CVU38_10840 [Chloroflexi bacterium HGW-Chloroflexi-1]|nr:MAG: hypothetical protein CVU38_10840 [Chloroflexi bacterium HGW-Chloroflexi-1]